MCVGGGVAFRNWRLLLGELGSRSDRSVYLTVDLGLVTHSLLEQSQRVQRGLPRGTFNLSREWTDGKPSSGYDKRPGFIIASRHRMPKCPNRLKIPLWILCYQILADTLSRDKASWVSKGSEFYYCQLTVGTWGLFH